MAFYFAFNIFLTFFLQMVIFIAFWDILQCGVCKIITCRYCVYV